MKESKQVQWKDMTNLFLKHLLEADNFYFGGAMSKNTLKKITDPKNPDTEALVHKMDLVSIDLSLNFI